MIYRIGDRSTPREIYLTALVEDASDGHVQIVGLEYEFTLDNPTIYDTQIARLEFMKLIKRHVESEYEHEALRCNPHGISCVLRLPDQAPLEMFEKAWKASSSTTHYPVYVPEAAVRNGWPRIYVRFLS